jgi:hypothetical protein
MNITVLIPTSSIPSCPSTEIIDETIASIKSHLPEVKVIVTCDGLQSKHECRRAQYEEYKTRIRADKVMIFETRVHQSGMILAALPLVETPLLFYLEHDWEVLHPIEWDVITDMILSGRANYVKLHSGSRIHPLYEHMMFKRIMYRGVPFIQTTQFSANPHLALTAWYRSLTPFFENKCEYVENLLHGETGNSPWEKHKLMIYNPIHGDMARVHHLDGRKGEAP